jgi:hypothetical protein
MLSKITNAGRTFASLISGRFGNNALATLNDINQVVDDINFINNFTDARILFTQTGTLNPTFRIISSGVSSSRCSKECDSGGGDVSGVCKSSSVSSLALLQRVLDMQVEV